MTDATTNGDQEREPGAFSAETACAEIALILSRGVRRHLQKSDARLGSSVFGWLPSAPGADIANAVNAFQSDG